MLHVSAIQCLGFGLLAFVREAAFKLRLHVLSSYFFRPVGQTHSQWHWVLQAILGGSWVVVSGVISRVIIVITYNSYKGLISPFITTHEPPSMIQWWVAVVLAAWCAYCCKS